MEFVGQLGNINLEKNKIILYDNSKNSFQT